MSERHAVHVAIYLDEAYAVPATVLVLSMVRHLCDASTVHLHVLSVGLGEETRRTMVASWPVDRVVVRWIDVDWREDAKGCLPTGYLSRAAYARLLIDRYLPAEIEKVLTIDTDGLILSDISELWRHAPRRACLMAVQDSFVRILADDRSEFIQDDADRHDAPYFNSGLMLIDTRRWRDLRVSERCLELAARHPGQATIGDNSLLNAVLKGDWERLPLRWNCSTRHLAIHMHPSIRGCVHPHREVVEAARNPGFLHFVSGRKPWHTGQYHPDRSLYLQYLGETAWPDRFADRPGDGSLWGRASFPWLCYRQARNAGTRWRVPRRSVLDFVHFLSRSLGTVARRTAGRPQPDPG